MKTLAADLLIYKTSQAQAKPMKISFRVSIPMRFLFLGAKLIFLWQNVSLQSSPLLCLSLKQKAPSNRFHIVKSEQHFPSNQSFSCLPLFLNIDIFLSPTALERILRHFNLPFFFS